MGFVQGVGRFFSGKPVFDASDMQVPGRPGSAQPQSNGQKSIPEVTIVGVETDISDQEMIVTVHIRNNSGVEVLLDKIRLVNTVKELDATLRAGEEKEYYAVYKGTKPNHAQYNECLLEYRTQEGDYFRSHHFVDFAYEKDGTYTVRNMRFTPPVRDI